MWNCSMSFGGKLKCLERNWNEVLGVCVIDRFKGFSVKSLNIFTLTINTYVNK